ncbi:hypothetical protein HJC23_008204 [Cyclotella cryptica]|uniref:Uncharacterized protein n=1 Tax=Cyclotella cryptica TaxID=29204 RepID=A0ABD3NVK4_9STRA|eukprot:CCRYP_019368-RA/>CCRYP_019368-RA protein AED:0.02 eAED:0.02 QI:239/1/1/1/1/1/2/132/378
MLSPRGHYKTMLLVKNLIVFTLLTSCVCDASDSRTKKNLRKTAVRYLSTYGTVNAFVSEDKKITKEDKSNKKATGKSNTLHFVSSGHVVGMGGSGKGSNSGYINYGTNKGKGSASGYANYGYSKGDSKSSTSAYLSYGYGKGDSKGVFFAKGSSNISESKIPGGGSTKNLKTSPLEIRPLPDMKPWSGDGHQPTNKPTFFEPAVTPEPTVWHGDGHPPKPELVDTTQPTPNPTSEPSNRPSPLPTDRPTNKPTKFPSKKPTPAPVTPVVTPKPTQTYYTPVPTMLEPAVTAKPTFAYIQPSPGYNVNVATPMLPGGQFRKEVDEQCDEVVMGDPEACIVRCVTVTSIFDGDILIDETSRTAESSCLNKRQQAKQNNGS